MVQQCLIQSFSFLRDKFSYADACKYIEYETLKNPNVKFTKKIITKKYYKFIRCKPNIAMKRFENLDKVTYSYAVGYTIVGYYSLPDSQLEEDEEEEEQEEEENSQSLIDMNHQTIQSVLIPRERYSLDEAIDYIKEHFKFKKVDITPKYYRFRQYQPKYLTNKLHLNNVMTSTNKETGIKLIIFFKQDIIFPDI